MSRRMLLSSAAVLLMLSAAFITAAAPAGAGGSVGPLITQISPVSGPQFSSILVKVHGRHFDTDPGATSISFGGTPALSVTCPSPGRCDAMTPEITSTGDVEVTVTVGAMTSNSVLFVVNTYSPPVVRIVLDAHGDAKFSQSQLGDSYPAASDPGNDFVDIENQTAVTQTTNSTDFGPLTLAPGAIEGYTLPLGGGPYVVFLASNSRTTLTLRANTPA